MTAQETEYDGEPDPEAERRGAERRVRPRVHLQPPHVATCALRTKDGRRVEAPIIDLSAEGVHTKVSEDAVPSWPGLRQELDVELTLDGGEPITARAEVVWFGGAVDHGRRTYRCGFRLWLSDPEQEARLGAWLDAVGG